MRFCLLFLAGLAGCAAQTWPAPWEGAKAAAEAQVAREVVVRAEYPDGRAAALVTLRVSDANEGVWWPATRADGTAPVSTNGLPLVSFSYRAADEPDGTPLHPLPPARRYGRLYVVTIPEAK